MNPQHSNSFDIRIAGYYSNGSYGRAWGVRQVLDFSLDAESGEETVTFKGIAGTCRRKTGSAPSPNSVSGRGTKWPSTKTQIGRAHV